MINRALRSNLELFLNTYYKFYINQKETNNGELVIQGSINIIDKNKQVWDDYDIKIVVPKNGFPHVIPLVYETSKKIKRDDKFHISNKGECCLDITHKLILEKNKGISLVSFYQKYIYPFFANHQYKLKTESYAGGEYQHHFDGIIQFYKEQYNLIDTTTITRHLELALGYEKAERNKTCPICGKPKYKKCCKPTVEKIKQYGKQQLKIDLELFKQNLNPTPNHYNQ